MRTLLATSLLALVVFAAGCGGSSSSSGNTNTNSSGEASKSAGAVLADAVKAADTATSFHMSGQINEAGSQVGIDLAVVVGKGATGSLTIKGAKVELIIVGGKGYLNGGSDFWKQFAGSSGAAIASLLNGKWLEFPAKNAQFAPLTGVADAKSIFDQLKTSAPGKLTNTGATTYKGQSVIAIDGGAANGTFYVANSGTPYPVALVKTGSSGGAITFDSWNASVTLTAPKGAIDFSHLSGG